MARVNVEPKEIESKNKTTGNPPIAAAPLITPEKKPTVRIEYQFAELLNRMFFQSNKLAVRTIPEMNNRIISCGTFSSKIIPKGVPITTPKTSQRRIFQSMERQTKGSMCILAAISSIYAVGTISEGGKISAKLVTVKAEKPKPL